MSTSSDSETSLLLFGAGGHARVVADAVLSAGQWRQVRASDRNEALCQGELLPGIPVLEVNAVASSQMRVHIAIGSNAAREHEAGLWGHHRLLSIIHPAAVVSRFSEVASGCFLAATSVTAPGVVMGKGVILNHGAVADHDVQIGDFCHVAPRAALGGAVVLGRRVLLGAGAVILPGMKITDDVTIGAGAVVTSDITQPGTYVGIPARKVL